MKKSVLSAVLMLVLSILTFGQKMTAEQVIAKHLDSIGAADLRAKVKNEAVLGSVTFSLALDKNSVYTGSAAFAGEDAKRLYGLNFNQPAAIDYPLERIIYNEKDLKIANVRLGQRSALGNYLLRNSRLLKDGLMAGGLFTDWAVGHLDTIKANLELDGDLKKINGVDAYQITYSPKKGFNVGIKMFFDAANFRHIRSEYRSEIGAQLGPTPQASSRQAETREIVVENFSDFKDESGLMLPHTYQIYYTVNGATSKEFVYNFKFDKFYFNSNLGDDPFELKN